MFQSLLCTYALHYLTGSRTQKQTIYYYIKKNNYYYYIMTLQARDVIIIIIIIIGVLIYRNIFSFLFHINHVNY